MIKFEEKKTKKFFFQIKFVKNNESLLKTFGMLRKWDDSKQFLLDNPHLCCDETANHLVLQCLDLEIQEVQFFFVCKKCNIFSICKLSRVDYIHIRGLIRKNGSNLGTGFQNRLGIFRGLISPLLTTMIRILFLETWSDSDCGLNLGAGS